MSGRRRPANPAMEPTAPDADQRCGSSRNVIRTRVRWLGRGIFMIITRRTFLKTGALGAAALPLWDPLSLTAAVQTLERRGPSQQVIVIGAGLSGLCTAYHLTESGHNVVVLEAQRRAGGRVQTLRDFSEDLCGEAGATRIPDYHNFTLKYVKLFGLDL